MKYSAYDKVTSSKVLYDEANFHDLTKEITKKPTAERRTSIPIVEPDVNGSKLVLEHVPDAIS